MGRHESRRPTTRRADERCPIGCTPPRREPLSKEDSFSGGRKPSEPLPPRSAGSHRSSDNEHWPRSLVSDAWWLYDRARARVRATAGSRADGAPSREVLTLGRSAEESLRGHSSANHLESRMEERFVYECPQHGTIASLSWADSLSRDAPSRCPTCGVDLGVLFMSSNERERLR